RASFIDAAAEQKAQRLVGKRVTLHCVGDFGSGIATVRDCRVKYARASTGGFGPSTRRRDSGLCRPAAPGGTSR
ncbi:hypothetical protein NO136_19915, partial [Clostridioides difficile]|nr:hypothetical protein [Clostridioides difficile]